MMRFKIYRTVKSIFLVSCTALAFVLFNTLTAQKVEFSKDKLSPSLNLKNGRGRDKPNGVRVIKRSLMQNGSSDKLNGSLKAIKENSVDFRNEKLEIDSNSKHVNRSTELKDIFISVKTTQKFHESRVQLQLDTWWTLAQEQTYFFTDENDEEYQTKTRGHMINTNCTKNTHNRMALCCKMSIEFDYFIQSEKRWFCHVDDDTYINVPRLVKFLQDYDANGMWYLGKPSISHPIETRDPDRPGSDFAVLAMQFDCVLQQRIAFWFATGGAGVCLSRGLALKIMPYTSGGKLKGVCDKIRLPDDCSLGYIITKLVKEELTVIPYFHSHLEGLWSINAHNLHDQITVSYGSNSGNGKSKMNVVQVKGLSEEDDPTRLHSTHCFLNPGSEACKRLGL